MIKTLRKNWVETAIICLCVAVVLYQTVAKGNQLYPLQYGVCWLLCWFMVGGFLSKYIPVKSQNNQELLRMFLPLFALGISDFFLKGHDFFSTWMSLFYFFVYRFTWMGAEASRNTNWKFLYKLIFGTLIFIVCFFAVLIYHWSAGKP